MNPTRLVESTRIALRLGCLVLCCMALMMRWVQAAPMRQPPNFDGVWASVGCEPYPGGPFAQRELTLAGKRFALSLTSFADAKCTIPTLKTRYEGTFVVRNPSPILPGAWNVDFSISRAFLTPLVSTTAEFLNSASRNTCGAATWYISVEQDVTVTRGCQLIGINLSRPLVEYDIIGLQGNQLALGQRPGDGGGLTTPERRPTTFGPPLVRAANTGSDTNTGILLPDTGGSRLEAPQEHAKQTRQL